MTRTRSCAAWRSDAALRRSVLPGFPTSGCKDLDTILVRQRVQELLDSLSGPWMHQLRGNLREWGKDEGTLMQTRVRQGQVKGGGDDNNQHEGNEIVRGRGV